MSLPVHITPFIGRQAELAEINSILARPEIRLVSIIGPGGIGKTRLAIAVASFMAPAFADGPK